VVPCGLEIMLYPQTVLFKRVAERASLARESQVRGRGSTRKPATTIGVETRARAGADQRPGLRDKRPLHTGALTDAARSQAGL
jgi:hypothetical protein